MESRGSYRLTVRQGPVPGKAFELVKDVLTIGRDVNNDVVVNDAEVSRNHTRLTAQSGGYLIEDLASTNGTFVNGQRLIGPRLLNNGDSVGLGETVVLEYSYTPADAGATMVAGSRMGAEMPPPMPEPPAMPSFEPAPMAPPEPPPMPEPEPMGSPATVGAPMYEPEAPPPPTPSMPPAAPFAPAKPDNRQRNMIIGGVCGCLTLCACVGIAAAVYANLPAILQALGLQ